MVKKSIKLVLVLAIVCIYFSSNVQAYTIHEGTISVSGSSTGIFESSNTDNSAYLGSQRSDSISVGSGYFIKDNIELGVLLSASYVSQGGLIASDSTSYSVQPFVTIHTPISDLSNIFYGIGIGMSYSQSRDYFDGPTMTYTTRGLIGSAKLGWEYFFNNWSAFQIAINASHANYRPTYDDKYKADTIATALGFSIYFK